MKKTLSLFLAVVMVAMMIPFATLTTVATDVVLYEKDFTKETANVVSGVGKTLALPEGWSGTKSQAVDVKSSVSEKGVLLGGTGQGITMTSRPAVNGAHVIEIKWNTEHKINTFRIGFTDSADKAPNEIALNNGTNIYTANQLIFAYLSGPTRGKSGADVGMNAAVDGYYYGGNVGWASAATDATSLWATNLFTATTNIVDGGNVVDPVIARMSLCGPAARGDEFTTYVVVKADNTVEKVCVETGSIRYEYLAPEGVTVSAAGRLVLWHSGDDNKAAMNIKSVRYIDNSNGTYKLPTLVPKDKAKVIHSYNFEDANNDISKVPYDIYSGGNASVSMKNGMLYLESSEKKTANHTKTALKIDREFFPDSGSYTLEFVLDGASYYDYFFPVFNMPEEMPESGFYVAETIRTRSGFAESGKGNSNYFMQNTGYINLIGANKNQNYAGIDKRMDGDIKYQIIIEDNKISGAFITVMTDEGNYTSVYSHTFHNPISHANSNTGDVGFIIRTSAACQASFAIKSIAILDKPLFEVDLNSYDTMITQITTKKVVTGGTLVDVVDLSVDKGVASKTSDNGIRFTSKVAADELQKIVDLYEGRSFAKVEFGTLITTAAQATAAGAVTHEALNAISGNEKAYTEVVATLNEWVELNTFAGEITAQGTTEYKAVGFIRITDNLGNVIVIYSDVTNATLASLA